MPEIKVEDVAQDSVEAEAANENGTAAADQAEDVWDEERIQGALDRLKEMYIQVSTSPHYPYSTRSYLS
jgi:hypothetical protein